MDKKTVLLVDDVKLFLKLEETFFKRAGCKVLTADSGAEAIKIAQEKKPDIILLDYYMPDLKGDEVCKKLKSAAQTQKIPIIIVSTSMKKEDVEACMQAGCDDYLTKPIQPETVLTRAAQLIGLSHRLHRRLAVNFRLEGEFPPLTFTGFSKNLSLGGILIEAEQKLKEGDRLRLWLPILEDKSMIEIPGQVVRWEQDVKRSKYLYGIRFLEMNAKTAQALEEYLDKLLPKEETIE